MDLRTKNLHQLQNKEVDVFVVGGGINGAASFAALSAQGLKVALVDREDFAANSSSQSSNLAWGGIKYLETHEYGLVNKLCKSRNHLARSFPSSVKEIRFLTSIRKGFRFPPFLIFLGTLVYWALGRFATKAPSYLRAKTLAEIEPTIRVSDVSGGFEYSDCYLHDNDSRFVFSFIHAGMNRGANAVNYTEVIGAQRAEDHWLIRLQDKVSGEHFSVNSKILINACGPNVDHFNLKNGQQTNHRHLYSKGVHLVVDKLTDSEKVLAFFASDGRLFFVLPMGNKTCIGTTDTQVTEPTNLVTDEDRSFILSNANLMLNLKVPLTLESIIAERCGVRPLAQSEENDTADWVKLSRKHAIDVDRNRSHISIFGGKLTDCINIGDEIVGLVDELRGSIKPNVESWYGESSESAKEEFFQRARELNLERKLTTIDGELVVERLWRRYDKGAYEILEAIDQDPSLLSTAIDETDFTIAEVLYAKKHEMIVYLSDLLRRRSMIELNVTTDTLEKSHGLQQACEILFDSKSQSQWNQYFLKS